MMEWALLLRSVHRVGHQQTPEVSISFACHDIVTLFPAPDDGPDSTVKFIFEIFRVRVSDLVGVCLVPELFPFGFIFLEQVSKALILMTVNPIVLVEHLDNCLIFLPRVAI